MRLIGLRMSNLRVRHWEILRADDGAGFFSFLEGKWKAVVIDLGSISNEAEKMTLAGAILSRIWSKREARKPVLVVADEAHYLAPPEPTTRLQESTCEYLVRIAGEGRKYGISLLVASQRPAKIHPSVVSQCDNLFLMKMSLQEDLNTIAGTFPRVPRAFIEHASSFRLGEVLVSGRVVRNPTFARFGGRLLREGGSDVRV
jgi:hypothetical protein